MNNDCSSDSDIEISEIYDAAGREEYCITSIIASSNGTMYYKNDSGHVFAVGFSAEGRTAAQQRHATAFQEKVDALFPVTIDSADAIAAARAAPPFPVDRANPPNQGASCKRRLPAEI